MHDRIAAGVLRNPPVERRSAAWQLCLPYFEALAIYLSSRLLVFVGIAFGLTYVPPGHDIQLGGSQWYHHLLRWDSEWYRTIASTGYSYNGEPGLPQTVVFYPLYPGLSRFASEVLGINVADAMLLVANLAATAAVLLLFKLVRERHGDRAALATVALIAFFPASVFLSAGYTESLALLLMVAFFSQPRPRALSDGCHIRRPCDRDGQAAFHESTTLMARLASALTLQPLGRINLTDISPAGLDQWFALICIALIMRAWFIGISRGWILFSILLLALPYVTLSGGPAGFTSMARFNLVSFPLFAVMALSAERWPWAMPAIVGIFGGLLMMYSALFAQWQWIG